jgi:plasmid stabilization system protein ParE
MKLRYHAAARKEIIDAAKYYELARIGLGDEFLVEIDTAIKRIMVDPSMFEQIRPGIRRCLVGRLPYGIYYRTPNADTVRVIVVKHHARRPGLGMRRK